MVIRVLFNKLLRTIWHTRGQFISLVIVLSLGIMTYTGMSTTYYNLENSMLSFYQECNFADYYFQVAGAPQQIIDQIQRLPGVTEVNGRVVKDLSVIKDNKERATVRIVGYPLSEGQIINRLHMFSGRVFDDAVDSGITAILDPQFAASNQLSPGSTLTVAANGREVPIIIRGTAATPEFTYPVKDVTVMLNDPTRFGVAIIPQDQAQQLLNMSGQINSIIIKMAPDTNELRLIEDVKAVLKPYGYQGDYGKEDQSSHSFLKDQLRQLRAETLVIPGIFLVIAIAIQFVMLARMIKTQRLQIGIMKALGYTSLQIIGHYVSYAVLIGLIGTTVGIVAGLAISEYLTDVYLSFYNLPHYTIILSAGVVSTAAVLGVGVGLLSGWLATRRIVLISPAESMRPDPPTKGRRIMFENWSRLWETVSSAWKIAMRGIGRHPLRFWVTALGVSCAVSLLVVSMFFHDSIAYIEQKAYYTDQKFDLMAKFGSPVDMNTAHLVERIQGVIWAEPIMEIPVSLTSSEKSTDVILQGLAPGYRMKEIESREGQILQVPQQGIVVGLKTAEKLDLEVGELIQVETKLGLGSNQITPLQVAGIARQAAGKNAFVSMETANQLLKENRLISGVMMMVDQGRYKDVEAELADMPGVADIVSRSKEIENFNRNMDNLKVTMLVLTLFAILLGCAISYNSSVISLGERNRELATLKVIGMKDSEIASILGNETILQCFLGLCIGIPLGRLLAEGVARMVSSEVYEFQAIVYPETYLLSTVLTATFVLAGYLVAVLRIKQLDLLETLKNRD